MKHPKRNVRANARARVVRRSGHLEISAPADIQKFKLKLSDAVIDEIRELEESLIAAEQQFGTFRIG